MAKVERPSIVKRLLSTVGLMTSSDVARMFSNAILSTPQDVGGEAGAKTYQQIIACYRSWTYICVDKIAKTVAMLPMQLYAYKQGGKFISGHQVKAQLREMKSDRREVARFIKAENLDRVEITNHPFLDLQRTPNPLMTRFTLWYNILVRMELAGFCGIYTPRKGPAGIPSEMWALPLTDTALLKANVDRTKLVRSWRYEDGDVREDLSTDACHVVMYPNPESPFEGKSPLLAQQYPYDIDYYLDVQQRAFLMKHSAFGNVFSTDAKLQEPQVAALKALLKSQYAGAQKSGDAIIVHSGLRLDKSIVMNDTMNVDLARFARDKLIATHDLTPSHVGIDREVNRTTMEVLDDVFIRECLRPKTQMIEEFFESFILPMYDDRLLLDFELPDTKDKDFELKQRDSNLDHAYSTINEERAKEGLDSVDWGERPLVSFTMMPMAGTKKPIELQPTAKRFDPEIKVASPIAAQSLSEETKTALWNGFVKQADHWEAVIIRVMTELFDEQCDRVVKKLNAEGTKLQGNLAGWSKDKIRQHIKAKDATAKLNLDRGAEIARTKEVMEPVLTAILADAGASRIQTLLRTPIKAARQEIKETIPTPAVAFNSNDPRVRAWLGDRMDEFSEEVTGTTFDAIKATLREGFTEGKPLATIAQELRETFDSFESYRAPLIARSETISALNRGDFEGIQQSGLKERLVKHWLSARDGHERETHREADIRYAEDGIDIDEEFQVGEDHMVMPGNGSLPEENIQCRCTVLYSVKEE